MNIEGLDPKKTIIISALGKELPFRGSKRDYTIWHQEKNPNGNMIVTSSPKEVERWLKWVNTHRPEIENVVLDDNTHNFSMEYMRRIGEKTFDKFNDIGYYMSAIASGVKGFRDNLFIFFLHHTRETGDGLLESKQTSAMTIGKLVDEKLSGYESFFTVVLRATKTIEDEQIKYHFLTQDAYSTAKSPIGMFTETVIPNDLGLVKSCMEKYYSGETE